jgi:hypothetical protein
MMVVTITNRLRIYEGNIILIPGCEPISVVTHISNYQYNPDVITLYNNYDTICSSSYVTLTRAMELIPDATLYYGHDPANRWFILPDGPPPSSKCPKDCVDDWYLILREGANGVIDNNGDSHSNGECSGFSFDWCDYNGIT